MNPGILLVLLLSTSCIWAAETGAQYSVERIPIEGGAELLTIFQSTGSARVPLLSVVRDTMGDEDPANNRLRYLWLLNNARPAWWQRIAAAMPFYYRAAGTRKDGLTPRPLIDVASTHPHVMSDLGRTALQIWTFDPAGLALRASTRAYQGNLLNEQRSNFEQAFAVIDSFEEQSGSAGVFSESESDRLRARLLLGQRRFGGLVSESRFAQVAENEIRESEEARGRNWEILRQAAESSGLVFEPIELGHREANYALIWFEKGRKFVNGTAYDAQFLRIRDPWTDPRLQNWKGYTKGDLIPLALYDLEHRRSPLLLVDFRDNLRPKRKEIFERSLTDLMKSVFGLSYVRDWYLYATRGAHDFVAGRRGAALDPLERLRAYAKLKLRLELDQSFDPPLREELQKQLAHLALNPLETDLEGEALVAQQHYELLTRDLKGLAKRLARDRSKELAQARHYPITRVFLSIYRHREQLDLAELDTQRRAESAERLLKAVAASPRIEIDWNTDQVRQAIETLGRARPRPARAELLRQLLERTQDIHLKETLAARPANTSSHTGAGAAFLLGPR